MSLKYILFPWVYCAKSKKLIKQPLNKNKDENVHRFPLSAIRGELLERERGRERESERAREREREGDQNIIIKDKSKKWGKKWDGTKKWDIR